MSAVKNSEITESGQVRIPETLFPETHKNEEYSVLEPYILQEHAENNNRLDYQAIEEDGCPKVVVSSEENYFETGELTEGNIAYSSKMTPEGITIIEMYVNTKSPTGKATGSQPWENIIETLKERSREREKSMIDARKMLRG